MNMKKTSDRNKVKKKDTQKFFKTVKTFIDKGTPLFWTIPGHIRLIIGYNLNKDGSGEPDILYSDSWGHAGYGRVSATQGRMETVAIFVIK